MTQDTPADTAHHGHVYQRIGLWLGPLAAILVLLFGSLDPANPIVTRTAAVAVLMAVWWLTDALPLSVTALLPVVLFPALGIMSGKDTSLRYFDDIIFLFIGGFLVAIAMERWNLHRRIALRILLLFGLKPRMILLGFMVSTAFLSMWISNTATAMMMVPIGIALLAKLADITGEEAVSRYSLAVLLGIAYAASIGGIATPVGTPPNLVFLGVYHQQFPDAPEISFPKWMMFATPLAIAMLLFTWGALSFLFKLGRDVGRVESAIFHEQYRELGPMSRAEIIVLIDFVALAILWITRSTITIGGTTFHGWGELFPNAKFITDGTTAIALALPLFIIPSGSPTHHHLLDSTSIQNLPWGIVLLFGGGLALAAGFETSGLSAWVGGRLTVLGHLHPLLVIAIVCTLITFLTELTSNTATAQVLLPILAANAIALGIDPLLLMIPGVLSASYAFMMPVGTPPNAIIFATGRVTMPQMARVGIVLNLAGIIFTTLAIWTLGRYVLGIDVQGLPQWAVK